MKRGCNHGSLEGDFGDTRSPIGEPLASDALLFVAENNLVVEGTLDYAYLSVISDYLELKDRSTLGK